MEYFVVTEGKKLGPLTQFRLVELLRDGQVTPESKIWHKDMTGWMPMQDEPSMSSSVQAFRRESGEEKVEEPPVTEEIVTDQPDQPPTPTVSASADEPVDAGQVRPLARFWARQFDYTLVGILVLYFSKIDVPKIDPDMSQEEAVEFYKELLANEQMHQLGQVTIYALLLWHVVEGVMLHLFKTTPGKWLFGIRVVDHSGSNISPMVGICRAFLVCILGVGLFYEPLLTLGLMAYSFFRLMRRGSTLWDQALLMKVETPPVSPARILLAVTAFLTLMTLQYLKFT